MWRRICPAESSRPIPYPSTPTLLLIVVRFFVPLRASARMRFSGMPHRPKPPIMMVEPSGTSRMASSALATTFFIAKIVKEFHHGDTEARRKEGPEIRNEKGHDYSAFACDHNLLILIFSSCV